MGFFIEKIGFIFTTISHEITHFAAGVETTAASGHLFMLFICLVLAFGFEFVNGFHDTANAVATVIYTKSMRPWPAVVWSGFCNFLGVFIGGTIVAMAIIKLIPPNLIMTADLNQSMAFVFSLLLGAVIWNLGTWYLGIPASSSHTLVGSILGIGIGHSLFETGSIVNGVNWGKAADIGLALLFSPLIGFALAAMVFAIFKLFFRNSILHEAPKTDAPPPWPVRLALIGTSTGVSFAHGSNDGQKGVGLVMIILVALMPAQFALKTDANIFQYQEVTEVMPKLIDENLNAIVLSGNKTPANGNLLFKQAIAAEIKPSLEIEKANAIKGNLAAINEYITELKTTDEPGRVRFLIRNQIMTMDKNLRDLEKGQTPFTQTAQWTKISQLRARLVSLTDYAPVMVLILIALSLGLGTTIGWRRIVVTIGEKIGKTHMTYAQGVSAELVAMSTIGISAVVGLPVSTTHVLSSGVAGSMVANKSGIQSGTAKKILSAWILTLPATMFFVSIYLLCDSKMGFKPLGFN